MEPSEILGVYVDSLAANLVHPCTKLLPKICRGFYLPNTPWNSMDVGIQVSIPGL